MRYFRKLNRHIKRLIRLLDIDDIPPASLMFFGGCFILAIIGFFSWRGDRNLLANGREIRAEVIDRRIDEDVNCDSDDLSETCTIDISYFITYQFNIEGESFTEEKAVTSGIYDRTESSIFVRYLPNQPSVSNVAETVENGLSFPLFSMVVVLVGLIGAAVIFWIS